MAAHLVADVPVSSFLSGGLDSSIVTVLAHQAAQEIDAYTITFRPEDQRLEAMPDDAVYARKVAARFGVQLHEIEISPDIVDLLPRMVDALDEPIGDPAAINTLLMCQAARERGVKVILSGMGADELFGGYRKHLACVMAGRYSRLPGAARAGVRYGVDRFPVSFHGRGLRYARFAKRFLTFAELPEEPRFRRSYTLYDAGRADRPGQPGPGRLRGPGHRRPQPHLPRQLAARTRSTGCAWPTRGCSCPGSTWPTRTGRAWRPPSRYASRSSIRSWPARRSRSRAATRSRAGRARSRSSAPRRAGCPRRSCTGRRLPSAPRCGPGCATTCRSVINDVLVGGELAGSGMIRADALRRLIHDEQAGREDRAKQIWQLLTMELWYRNMRSMGVAA